MHWLLYSLGLRGADTQTSPAERECLCRRASGRKRLVEIGVHHGLTTALLRGAMHPDGRLVGIDPHPRGRLGVSFERLIAKRELAGVRQGQVDLLRTTSHEAAAGWEEPIDFLFIDGDHSWEGVEQDWNDWSEWVLAGGVVALHDSRPVAGCPETDVVRFTREVVLQDPRFREVEHVDSLTVLEKLDASG